MRVISRPECDEWLKENIGGDCILEGVERGYAYRADYLLPPDAGKKTALGRMLIGLLHVKSSGLFWITATGIWPSSENIALFEGYRRSFGENRPLHAAPGHVFSGSDLTQLECLFDLTLYFSWDSLLFEEPGGVALRTSHDEYISVHSENRDRLSQIEGTLAEFGLEQLVRG
jgi:hypothetical protein